MDEAQWGIEPDVGYFVLSKCSRELLVRIVSLDEVRAEQSHVLTFLLLAPAHPGPAVEGRPGVSDQHQDLGGQLSPEYFLSETHHQSDDLDCHYGEQPAEERQEPRAPAVEGPEPPPECGVSGKSNVVPLLVVEIGAHIVKITTQN